MHALELFQYMSPDENRSPYIALAVINLCLSEGISHSDSQSVEKSVKNL